MPTGVNDHKPEEYKNNGAMFCGRKFFVDQNVLIPRIETEEIIELVLSSFWPRPESIIADIGCGSGCLGITLAEKYPNSTVYISDISEKALEVAKKNINTKNVVPLVSNLLTRYPTNLLFDIIVANLPYIPTARIPTLQESVKDFEPISALDGGHDGTTIINDLLFQLPGHLKPDGLAILEIDDTHTLKSFSIPKGFMGEIKKDQFGRNRFLILHADIV